MTEDQGWRIEIKKYPLLTEKGAVRKSTALSLTGYDEHKEPRDYTEYGRGLYYTQDEVREVVAYAAERKINIIPEIDMPGHFVAAIACYPELSCTGEQVEVSDRWGVLTTSPAAEKRYLQFRERRHRRALRAISISIFPYWRRRGAERSLEGLSKLSGENQGAWIEGRKCAANAF